jgi:hypothetical protein
MWAKAREFSKLFRQMSNLLSPIIDEVFHHEQDYSQGQEVHLPAVLNPVCTIHCKLNKTKVGVKCNLARQEQPSIAAQWHRAFRNNA